MLELKFDGVYQIVSDGEVMHQTSDKFEADDMFAYITDNFDEYYARLHPPTQMDRIEASQELSADTQAEMLINQIDSQAMSDMIMDTLAEILLNQMGV